MPTPLVVDELHLFVYPLTLGAGRRLFTEGSALKLSLKECESDANGAIHLKYRLAPQA